jgi:AcrR family transcriptional regulator
MSSPADIEQRTAARPMPDLPPEVADAVRESVLAVGVRRTTLTDVARRAGVSRMTLYRMAPDVEALILAVMTSDFAGLLADAEAASARRRTARARLVAMTVDVCRRSHCSAGSSTSTPSSFCRTSSTGSAPRSGWRSDMSSG